MNKIRKLLIPALFFCLTISGAAVFESHAEETQGEQASAGSALQDENPQRLEEVTGMDENGNIYEVDDSEGTVQQPKMRLFSRTSSIQVVNFRTKGNATTSYKEYHTGVAGYTNGAYGADAAYLGTYDGKVRFMLSGVVGEVAASEVQVINLSDAKSYSCYKVSNGKLLHYVTQDMTTPGHATTLDNGNAPSYLSSGTTYYSYDGHYFYTDYAVMLDDYRSETRSHSVNPDSPYYNYFQYLPLRSETSYSAADLNGMINPRAGSSSKMYNVGDFLISGQNTSGVNAMIMACIGANESGWGKSSIAMEKNNLFGLNAVDTSPGTSASTYASPQECIRQYADGWMSRGYLFPNDWRYKGGFLGNKGSGINVSYASDPYWGERNANLLWSLDRNAGMRDAYKYSLGIKDTVNTSHNNVNVRNAASASGTLLYKTGGWANYAVLIQNTTAENGFYRIQSDAVLNGDRSSVVEKQGNYNYDQMYAYISADYVSVVSQGANVEVKKELSSIEIKQAPAKTSYTAGENFDPAGISVAAKWSDGSETDVTKDVTYSAGTMQTGMTSVTVSYTAENVTKTAEQAVTVTEPTTVESVAVNPAEAKLQPGEGLTFGVAVTGTGDFSKEVNWSVAGAVSADTKIDENGKLEIGADETAQTLTVTVTSAADPAKKAEAVVTVVPVEEPTEPSEPTEPVEPTEPETPEVSEPVIETVKDEVTGIAVKGELDQGTTIAVNQVAEESEQYAAYTEPVKGHTILGVYDITISQELEEGQSVELAFPIDKAYEGQKIIVLHYTEKDGEAFMETYDPEVENGQAVIETTGFSPYVVALNDPPAEEPDGSEPNPPAEEPDNSQPNPPAEEPDNGQPNPPVNNGGAGGNSNSAVTDTNQPNSPSDDQNQSGNTSQNGQNQTGNTTQNNQNQFGNTTQNNQNQSGNSTQNNQNQSGNLTQNNGQNSQTTDSGKDTQTPSAAPSGDTKTTDTKAAPKTGDESPIGLWIVMMLLAVSGVGYWVYEKRKSVR